MLAIKEIEQSNSGTFMCEVFDPASDQTATTRLDIDVIGKFWHLKNKSTQRQILIPNTLQDENIHRI
mgnify:FL=1